jgi:RimJ/RimL family protein N-acetyltransferase
MIAKPIDNPSPVWDLIKTRMLDDGGLIATQGEFIGIFDDDDMIAAYQIKRWNDYCFEINGGVHPAWWGKGAEICEFLGKMIFYNTSCLKIIAIIPEYNRLMRKAVQKAGLVQEGIITKSFLKWMKMHDMYVYGITKDKARKEGRLWLQQ